MKLVELLKQHFKNTFVEITLAKPGNHFTKPGYRKYQMMKNSPYLPKAFAESSNSAASSNSSSQLCDVNSHLTTPSPLSASNWIHSLPSSPVSFPSSTNPWQENDQFFDEEQSNIFHFNFPITYHLQNGVRNMQRYNEFMGLEDCNSTMNNLKLCCHKDYLWQFQDILESQYENRRY
ncbi:uncharacterized protein LOC123317159 isoform X2 [Coccinella septempunctata]|uniref:uncharacterized protein LOC123317159 isoform X2 n=1 Tax=Coccinella septempunctata TaxID=41139 RepID=UPI001D095B64|nr:uncharacterized protein LOC123317159 isoform X2 [Coccinella septempunctata]